MPPSETTPKRDWLIGSIKAKLTARQSNALGSSERVDAYCQLMADLALADGVFDTTSLERWMPEPGRKPN